VGRGAAAREGRAGPGQRQRANVRDSIVISWRGKSHCKRVLGAVVLRSCWTALVGNNKYQPKHHEGTSWAHGCALLEDDEAAHHARKGVLPSLCLMLRIFHRALLLRERAKCGSDCAGYALSDTGSTRASTKLRLHRASYHTPSDGCDSDSDCSGSSHPPPSSPTAPTPPL
jgi:hypothetical protein